MMAASLQGVPLARLGPRPACSGRSSSRRLPRGVQAAAERDQAGDVMRPVDIIKRDLAFLEGRTGLDLHTPLATVASAHDELVAVLNPIAGANMARDLEEQIAGLQQQLAVAHQQVHATEQRVDDTVRNLTELESTLRRAWEAGTAAEPSFTAATSQRAVVQQQLPQQQGAASAQLGGNNVSSGVAVAAPAAAGRAVHSSVSAPQQQQWQQAVQEPSRGQRSGLASSLQLPENLKNFWFPVEFSSRLGSDLMLPLDLFEQSWVLFRDEAGAVGCVKDECAHRACPLSLGKVVDGQPQCPYHGWQYDRSGACTKMPSTVFCKGISISALPVVEQDGFIWVWPGERELMTPAPPSVGKAPEGFEVHAELVMEVPVEHGLLIENLLDLAHAPFTHTSTFAKGWPVPDVVRFHAGKLLGGHWEPYPIDMSFEPPCITLSTIGLSQPGKIERGARAQGCTNHLHQLHACLPSSPGKTKLLYRMSLDFMHWTKHVPGIQKVWESVASQVLGEDLVLVVGQQDRLSRGGDVWRNPVAYDKLGVRYRRWRNAVAAGDDSWRRQLESRMRPLSAGELFDHSSDEDGLLSCELGASDQLDL